MIKFAIVACLALIAVGDVLAARCPYPELKPLEDAKHRVRQFLVVEPLPAQGERPELSLGMVLVAVHEDDENVWLAHYRILRNCVLETTGPVPRTHLIEGVDAMTVGDVVREHPGLGERLREEYPLARHLIREDNGVELRTLLPPEARTRPRLAPREDAAENESATLGDTYFWRYVMEIREDGEGNRWLLLSTHSRVHDSDALDTRANHTQEGQFRLQGWVPEKNLHPWPTNVVLELNAHREAVVERIRDRNEPAAIISGLPRKAVRGRAGSLVDLASEEKLEVFAKESADFWSAAFFDGNEAVKDNPYVAQFLPYGLRASTVRAHVQAFDAEGGWVRVATLAGLEGTINYAEWIKVTRSMIRVIEELSRIEVLIVLDATGSVIREIDDIREALLLLNRRLVRTASSNAKVSSASFQTLTDLAISELPVDVRVSLMIFSDQTHDDADSGTMLSCAGFENRVPKVKIPRTGYVFRGLSVRNEISKIQRGVDTARCIVAQGDGGIEEAVLNALSRGIQDRGVWGDRMIGQQVIVLVTDEPSTTISGADTPSQLEALVEKVSRTTRLEAEETSRKAGYAKLRKHVPDPEILDQLQKISDRETQARLREELEAREIALFRGSLIFTGSEAYLKVLAEQLGPSGLFAEQRTYWSDLDGDGSKASFAYAPEAIGLTIEEEQIRLIAEAVSLERCALEPEACKSTILRLPSQGTSFIATPAGARQIRAMYRAATQGIDRAVLAQHVKQGYVTGYTRIRDGSGRRATWSQSVMVTERQMRDYVRILKGLLYGLDDTVSGLNKCAWPYQTFGRVLLFFQTVIKEPPANDPEGLQAAEAHFLDPDSCAKADLLFTQGYTGSIQEHLGLSAPFSVNSTGVFGLPIETIKERIASGELKPAEVLERLRLKALCLSVMQGNGKLLDAQALDPDEPEPWSYCDSGQSRSAYDWSVKLSHRYGGEYIFIPMHLLP